MEDISMLINGGKINVKKKVSKQVTVNYLKNILFFFM